MTWLLEQPKLRRVLAPKPPSLVERMDDWYRRNWKQAFFWVAMFCLCAGVGYGLSGCASADPRHDPCDPSNVDQDLCATPSQP